MSETGMTTERQDEGLPERWSAQRKTEVGLRVIRGEALDEVAREIQVPAHEVEEWRRVFLEGGQQGLKRRGLDPEERELRPLQARIGDMTMRLELAEHLLEKGGSRLALLAVRVLYTTGRLSCAVTPGSGPCPADLRRASGRPAAGSLLPRRRAERAAQNRQLLWV